MALTGRNPILDLPIEPLMDWRRKAGFPQNVRAPDGGMTSFWLMPEGQGIQEALDRRLLTEGNLRDVTPPAVPESKAAPTVPSRAGAKEVEWTDEYVMPGQHAPATARGRVWNEPGAPRTREGSVIMRPHVGKYPTEPKPPSFGQRYAAMAKSAAKAAGLPPMSDTEASELAEMFSRATTSRKDALRAMVTYFNQMGVQHKRARELELVGKMQGEQADKNRALAEKGQELEREKFEHQKAMDTKILALKEAAAKDPSGRAQNLLQTLLPAIVASAQQGRDPFANPMVKLLLGQVGIDVSNLPSVEPEPGAHLSPEQRGAVEQNKLGLESKLMRPSQYDWDFDAAAEDYDELTRWMNPAEREALNKRLLPIWREKVAEYSREEEPRSLGGRAAEGISRFIQGEWPQEKFLADWNTFAKRLETPRAKSLTPGGVMRRK